MAHILIVEDEPQLREALELNLEYEGHALELAATGDAGLERALRGDLDLVLLDIMLPGASGFEVLKRLRAAGIQTPVIMLTARHLEDDKVRALKLGADDYVTKPFQIRELAARIEAVLRRVAAAGDGRQLPALERFSFADVVVDFGARTVHKAGAPVTLAFKEFELLRLLVEHRGLTVSRTVMLDEVWGFEPRAQPTTRTVDTHIAILRKKLEDDVERGRYIRTVHKIGYRLVPEGDAG